MWPIPGSVPHWKGWYQSLCMVMRRLSLGVDCRAKNLFQFVNWGALELC
jgi:hypothetical protein